jgi:hypothetical protein
MGTASTRKTIKDYITRDEKSKVKFGFFVACHKASFRPEASWPQGGRKSSGLPLAETIGHDGNADQKPDVA